MKIIILGAGRVGSSVAENLVSEQNDITVIDIDAAPLNQLQERLDLRVVVGSGTHPSVLASAGAEDADMFIACATSDEVNLVACRIARQVFNVPQRIARIRSNEFVDQPDLIGPDGFGIDHLISPERAVTTYLLRLIEFPEALQVVDFAGGKAILVLGKLGPGSPMRNLRVDELAATNGANARLLAIYRDDRPIEAEPKTRLQDNDEVLFLVERQQAHRAMRALQRSERAARRIMVAGGGNIGARLARELADQGYAVKLIEHQASRCEQLATTLPSKVLVLHGDATDEILLEDENVDSADVFLAITNDDENNIMAALLAKRMGARRVMSLISRRSYGELMEGSRIDVAVAPDQTTIGELLRYVRRGDVVAVHRLRRGAVEALEAVAHGDADTSRVVGRRISDVPLPEGASIGALVRGNDILMPDTDPMIESEDHVIVLVTRRRLIPQVERLFQVSAAYF